MKSEFGIIDLKIAWNLTLFSIFIGIGHSFSQLSRTTAILTLLIIIISAFKNPFVCLALYIISSLFISEIFPAYVSVFLLATISSLLFFKHPKIIRKFKAGVLLLSGICIIILSYIGGYKSNVNAAILMALCMITVLILYNCEDIMTDVDISTFVWAYICQAFTISIYFAGKLFNGGLSYTYGRLSFSGDIKTVSIIVSIPLVLILCTKLERKKLFQNFDFGVWAYAIVLLFSVILIATAARGMILAVLVAVVVQALFTKNKKSIIIKLLPIVCFLMLFIISNLDNPSLRISRLFEESEFASGNGRIEIWGTYTSTIFNSGLHRILLGMGPGEISRIGNSGYYAHSVFLDFFFSYGLMGFVTVTICETKLLLTAIKSKDIIITSLMVSLIIMYSGHGSCASTSLFILQIVLYIISKRRNTYENLYTSKLV